VRLPKWLIFDGNFRHFFITQEKETAQKFPIKLGSRAHKFDFLMQICVFRRNNNA
jgi:hypothetical protein